MQFASLISSLINIISLDVTSFNSAVTLKLKCGKVVCVEFFIRTIRRQRKTKVKGLGLNISYGTGI